MICCTCVISYVVFARAMLPKEISGEFGAGGAYSIGVYLAKSPFLIIERSLEGTPIPNGISNPVLSAHSVTDKEGVKFVADPFVVITGDSEKNRRYYMFFE